jgi:TrbL/VirB6 plasmid conjugal transfer protein
MNDFNTLFPNFSNQCAEMSRVLLPVSFVLLCIGIVSSTITGRRSPSAYLRTFGRTLAYVAVLTHLATWGNEISVTVDNTVKNTLQADPGGVYAQYNKALEVQKGTPDNRSWWEKLIDTDSFFEALISGVLYVFGLLASAIVFYAYLVQKFILYLGYALAPIFIGFLAVRTLSSIGTGYLLGLVGVMLWPLGWGAAAIMTKGLLDFMTDQSFLSGGAVGAAGYSLQNLIGVGILGIWLIFSTIAAPVILQKAVASGAQIGQALASGAATAGVAAATTGANTAATLASGGGLPAAAAGIAVGAAAGGVALAGASMSGSTYSPSGSLLSSLASQRKPSQPAKSDLSGDQAVRELLNRK